jgi:Fe-S cluster biogenesis protein NfuA
MIGFLPLPARGGARGGGGIVMILQSMSDLQQTIREKIEAILTEVRPSLQSHEGNAQLADVDVEGNITLKIEGTCRGCPMSALTFGLGVEKMIRERVPEVKEVFYS